MILSYTFFERNLQWKLLLVCIICYFGAGFGFNIHDCMYVLTSTVVVMEYVYKACKLLLILQKSVGNNNKFFLDF